MNLIPQRVRDLSFWHYQIFGWSLYTLIQFGLLILVRKTDSSILLSESIQSIFLFIVLLGLRWHYRRISLQDNTLFQLIGHIAAASFIASVLWFSILTGCDYIFWGKMVLRFLESPLRIILQIDYAIPVFLGWSALYFGIKAWHDWLEEQEQAELALEKAQRTQLEMLRYQLNPQFLFNALHHVRDLIDDNTRSAKTIITELSEFLRYSLVAHKQPLVPFSQELEAIRHYLSIEQKRYCDALQIHYSIDPRLQDIQIPSFIIFPIVEDALRSGMQSSPSHFLLEIHASLGTDRMTVEIIHSGNGELPQSDDQQQHSRHMTQERLKHVRPGQLHLTEVNDDAMSKTILELNISHGLNYEKEPAGHPR